MRIIPIRPSSRGAATAAAEAPTGGGFDVGEVFGELNIPILKNLLAAKDLSADISGRWSDYNTFGGVQNFKAGLNWSPTQDIRFRANIGTSTRQPAIAEAFGGDTLSFEQGHDPCAPDQQAMAPCRHRRRQLRQAEGSRSDSSRPATRSPTLIGGNPNLQPETSRTYTIGTVLTPRLLPTSRPPSITYHTSINNSIGEVPVAVHRGPVLTRRQLLRARSAIGAGDAQRLGNISPVCAPFETTSAWCAPTASTST